MSRYPNLRDYYVQQHRGPVYPHTFHFEEIEWGRQAKEKYGAGVEWIWEQCAATSTYGADVLLALHKLSDPTRFKADVPSAAMTIAQQAVEAHGVDLDYSFFDFFKPMVDPSRGSRFALFVLESVPRQDADTYIGVPSAEEAAQLTLALADYHYTIGRNPDPFDVGIYTITEQGRRTDYAPMVWSGANGRGVSFPPSIRKQFALDGHPLPKTVDDYRTIKPTVDAVCASVREERAAANPRHHRRFLGMNFG